MKMQKKNSSDASKPWKVLRIALLWTRKGGMLRRRLVMDLTKHLKSLRHRPQPAGRHYRECQFSFDDTPVLHFKMHRPESLRFKLPNIPCLNPRVDFDYDFNFSDIDNGGDYYNDSARRSFQRMEDEEVCDEKLPYEEECIDVRAEEFIAKFYEQMKLQRQISLLQYDGSA